MEIKPNKQPYSFKTTTKAKIDAILKDIERGAPNLYAVVANEMSEVQFYNLINQGMCDLQHEKTLTLPAYLVKSLRRIELEEIVSCKSDIRESQKGHAGAQWILERWYWRQFGNNAPAQELAEEIGRLKSQLLTTGVTDYVERLDSWSDKEKGSTQKRIAHQERGKDITEEVSES